MRGKRHKIILLVTFVLLGLFGQPSRALGMLTENGIVPPEMRITDHEARRTLARLLSYDAERLAESEQEYRALLAERPQDEEIRLAFTGVLMRQKKYGEARKEIDALLRKHPHNNKALHLLARLYLEGKDYKQAILVLEGLHEKGLLTPDGLMDLARAYTWNKQYEDAYRTFNEIPLDAVPSPAALLAETGDAYLSAGKISEAVEYYAKAHERDPVNDAITKKLALSLSWNKKDKEALRFLQTLHKRHPDDKDIGVELIRVYAKTGKTEKALPIAMALIRRFPEELELLMETADLESLFGHAEKSIDLYKKALRLSGNSDAVALRYADHIMQWGDFYRAESIYRRYLEKHGEAVHVSLKLAWALVSAQRYEEAEGIYRKIIMVHTGSPRQKALLELSRLKALEKDFTVALALIGQYLTLLPEDPRGLALKGEVLYQMGAYTEALSPLQKASQGKDPDSQVFLWLGKAYLKKGDGKEAKAAFSRANQFDPKDAEARYYLAGDEKASSADFLDGLLEPGKRPPLELTDWARVYASQGHNKLSIRCYENALKEDPRCFPAALGLAEILGVDRQYNLAIDAFERLATVYPENSKILISWARVLGWAKQYAQSLELYARIHKMNPSDPVPRREAARTAAWGKMMGKAMEIYAVMLQPSVDERLIAGLEAMDAAAESPVYVSVLDEARSVQGRGSIYRAYELLEKNMPQLKQAHSARSAGAVEILLVDLLPSYRIQKGVALESRAKLSAWNERFATAEKEYKELIEFQPGNEEALFDLGQVQCALGLCESEAKTYEALLRIDPLHSLAGYALKRQRIRRRPYAWAGHSYWDEEGRGGLTQITRNRTDLGVDVPLSCQYRLEIMGHHWDEDPKLQGKSRQANGYSLQLSGVVNSRVSGAIRLTKKDYEDSILDDKILGFAQVWFNAEDRFKVGIGYERRDELYNDFGIRQGIAADHWLLSVNSDTRSTLFQRGKGGYAGFEEGLGRKLSFRGVAEYIRYNDDNEGRNILVSAGYELTNHPKIFKVELAANHRDTKEGNIYIYGGNQLLDIIHPYWTPDDYYAATLTFEWYHDLSKIFICGGERHFYDLKLRFGTDNEDNPAAALEGEWHYEFRDRWTINLRGLIHRSDEWDASGLWFNILYRF